MSKLEKLIADYSQKYYTDGTSPVSDQEFDNLLEKVKEENPNSSVLDVGHGYKVENDTTYGEKFPHRYGLQGSLEKCRSFGELSMPLKVNSVDLSAKIDGLSVVLYYRQGKLIQALTRGDGKVGIDITNKVKLIIDDTLNESFTGAIRGEIVMSFDKFEKYKELHSDAKNPRNSAAGIVNSKSTDEVNFLDIIVYTIVGDERNKYKTIGQVREKLYILFSDVEVVKHTPSITLNEEEFTTTMEIVKDRWYGDYPYDGVVITQSDLVESDDNSVEYNAMAFKFKSDTKYCIVDDVVWKMSKTRYMIPRVKIEPVELAGTTVQYCSGFNAKYILDNKIGHGCKITVEKRGEIIPDIQEIVEPSIEATLPEHCPNCGSKLVWSGVHLKCPNENCQNAVEKDTLIWFNKLVPTDGIGDKLILKFLHILKDNGSIDDISVDSLMKSNIKLNENTDSAQYNTFANMWNRLHGDSSIKLSDAIEALNLPRFGNITSNKLSDHKDVLREMIRSEEEGYVLYDPFWRDLKVIIGDANAESLKRNLKKLSRLGYIWSRLDDKPDHYATYKVAITGKLSVSRNDFEKELKKKGYQLGDVTKETDFLITDDPEGSSSKNKKADKLGVTKISEAEFRRRYLNE